MRPSSVLLVLLVCMLSFASVHALCKCKKSNQAVGPCNVALDVCGCARLFTKKTVKATASASGVSVENKWFTPGAAKEAASGAIVQLTQRLSNPGQCNCNEGNLPFGHCSLPFRACFYFNDIPSLEAARTVFRAYVTAPNGAVAHVENGADAQTAVQSAVQQMLGTDPSIAAQCSVSSTEDVDFSAVQMLQTAVEAVQVPEVTRQDMIILTD